MNFKTTYILFGLFALILVVLGVTLYLGPSNTSDSKFLFPSLRDNSDALSPDEVRRVEEIEIHRTKPEEETITFKLDPGTQRWTVNGLRASKLRVVSLINQLFTADKTKADEAPKDLSVWELNPPNAVVTVKRGDAPVLTANIGKVSFGDKSAVVYATSSDRPKEALAIAKSKIDDVLKDVKSFRERELFSAANGDVQWIKLVEGAKPGIVLEKASDGSWKYVEPFKGAAQSSSEGAQDGKAPSSANALIGDLVNFKVEDEKGDDFVADDVAKADLAKYHLGPMDNVLRISIKRTEENLKTADVTVLVGVGKKLEEKKGTEKVEQYYACIEGENNVVRIAARNVEPILELMKNPGAMRDRQLVRTSKPVDAVVIRNSSGRLEFMKSGEAPRPMGPHDMRPAGENEWELYFKDEKLAVDYNAIVQTIPLLLRPGTIDSYAPANTTDADMGIPSDPDKAEAVVSVFVDSLEMPKNDDKKDGDKKDDKKPPPKLKDPSKPSVRLIFGKKGPNDTVAVKREIAGEDPVFVWVKDILLTRALMGPLGYMSKVLPSYGADPIRGVSKLELKIEGKDWVITREGGKDDKPWTIDKPENLKGRKADPNAVNRVLAQMKGMEAYSIDAESASDDALMNIYKLKPPDIRVDITVTSKVMDKDETKTYDYTFAKVREGKDAVKLRYGRQSQRPVVFSVLESSLADLNKEFLDTTVFAFDLNKVKAVKFEGWYSLEKEKKTLELEKAPTGLWVVKGTGAPASSSNVVTLLEKLSIPPFRAQRFVAHGVANPDPSYEFAIDKDGFVITLTVDGMMEPLQLTLGKLEGNSYFAISPQLKGDVFLVDKAPFEEARKKPAYFK